jgi:hypothetical protein
VVLNSLDASQEEKIIVLYGFGNTEYCKNDFRKIAGSYKEALKLNGKDSCHRGNIMLAIMISRTTGKKSRMIKLKKKARKKRQNIQKYLEEEKLKLDKQKLEISNKSIKKTEVTKNKFLSIKTGLESTICWETNLRKKSNMEF